MIKDIAAETCQDYLSLSFIPKKWVLVIFLAISSKSHMGIFFSTWVLYIGRISNILKNILFHSQFLVKIQVIGFT